LSADLGEHDFLHVLRHRADGRIHRSLLAYRGTSQPLCHCGLDCQTASCSRALRTTGPRVRSHSRHR
jgi:hypothetical protein